MAPAASARWRVMLVRPPSKLKGTEHGGPHPQTEQFQVLLAIRIVRVRVYLDLCLYVDVYDSRILIYDLQTTPTYNHIRSLHR